MKIVFFGATDFSRLVLPYLEKNFEVELVVDENNLDFEKVKKTTSGIAVLAAFGKILPKEILNHFEYGILNIHPSLLPKYRGPSPVQTAILNGDKETGVSVIKLDEEMDHGPILAQEKVIIKSDDTTQSLYERLFEIGSNLIYQNINQYIKEELKLTEQSHENATFTKLLTRADGYFDINNPLSLEKLDLRTRAFYPWPSAWTRSIINGKSLIIKFLPEKKVQVEGKTPVTYKDFINGYPNLDKNLLNLLR
jgi:methionyl-tRNA formyltransferase